MLNDVTIGITAFDRPQHLEQLVSSILLRYPRARIVVADNGSRKARLPKQVKLIDLPFDVGLSQARNALADQLETKYLLILEDDFLFTDETEIERLVEVLEWDEEVGVVAGALRSRNGRVSAYSLDIEIFRDTFYVRKSEHRLRVTSSGTAYRICDVIWNFALFRAEMLKEHRWDDGLKVGEHAPFFHQVKMAARWRVACCPSVVLYHVPDNRTGEYQRYRQRARKHFREYLARYNLSQYYRIPPMRFLDDLELKPCVVVMGVGHSGTSVLAKMLHAAGWEPGDADRPYGESFSIREINRQVQKTGVFPYEKAKAVLTNLPRPWAIKDPRFVMTLHHWLPVLNQLENAPALLRIVRDSSEVEKSYERRGVPGDLRALVRERTRMCQGQYENWPWMRMTIEFERLGVAAALFDPERISPPATPESTRAKPQPPKPFRPMTDSDDNAHFAALDWDSADPARSLKDEFHQQAENAWLEDSFLPHHHSPSQMAQWDSHLFEEMPGADDREFDANDEKAGSG